MVLLLCLLFLNQGEHTDYQEGFVFPAALDRKTVVALSLNKSGKYKVVSHDLKKEEHWDQTPPTEAPENPEWYCYILGPIRLFCEVAKVEFPAGFNLLCCTTVPIGSGLSSSAALEVATVTAMESATGITLDPITKARDVCQAAEHRWAKVPCGLMDQAIRYNLVLKALFGVVRFQIASLSLFLIFRFAGL